jgi:hypothetical protein
MLVPAVNTDMWLPTERIVLTDKSDLVGYVLEAEDGRYTVLERGSPGVRTANKSAAASTWAGVDVVSPCRCG